MSEKEKTVEVGINRIVKKGIVNESKRDAEIDSEQMRRKWKLINSEETW